MATRHHQAASRAADGAMSMLDGGKLRLMDRRGLSLGESRFGTPAFPAAQRGMTTAMNMMPMTPAEASGAPDNWQAVASNGVVVLSGPVAGHVSIDRNWVEAGSLVTVASFTYREDLG